jgi:hypothetical protein
MLPALHMLYSLHYILTSVKAWVTNMNFFLYSMAK